MKAFEQQPKMGTLVLSELLGTFEFQEDPPIGVYNLLTPPPSPIQREGILEPLSSPPLAGGGCGDGDKKGISNTIELQISPGQWIKIEGFYQMRSRNPVALFVSYKIIKA